MLDCTQSKTQSQLDIDLETGEITTTRKNGPPSHKTKGKSRENFTDEPVKNYRPNGKKHFGKLHDLGAHAMLQMPVCKLTKVVALMLRDSTFKGISYINPSLISKDLSIDIGYARKLLKKIEDSEFAIRVETGSGFYYLINPAYYMAGDDEDEQIAKRMWASARTKRIKAKDKKRNVD